MTILEKVKRLEEYLAVDSSAIDPVIDMAIDKLLTREITRIHKLESRFTNQIKEFEEKYGLSSSVFYKRYENGDMGDEMDYVEWASTIEMLENVKKRLALLEKKSVS